jgi:hypothetical protein
MKENITAYLFLLAIFIGIVFLIKGIVLAFFSLI